MVGFGVYCFVCTFQRLPTEHKRVLVRCRCGRIGTEDWGLPTMRLPYLRILLAFLGTYVIGGYAWLWYAAHIVKDEHGNVAQYKVEADRMILRAR